MTTKIFKMNTFDKKCNDNNLYCLSTGWATSTDITTELLNATNLGKRWSSEFKSECMNDSKPIKKAIGRRKVQNFADGAVKMKTRGKNMKLKEIQGICDLLGRLLYLATMSNIDLKLVFIFPLTPVPLSLGHVDGSMNKTEKSKLQDHLKLKCDVTPPSHIDLCIVDAMFLIHTLMELPSTYGGLAEMILNMLCKMAKTVHFVCDSYVYPSIKDIERKNRDADDVAAPIMISGPALKYEFEGNSRNL